MICTELKIMPGPALCQIGDADDLQAACRRMRRDRSSHAWAAMQLIRAKLQGARVLAQRPG